MLISRFTQFPWQTPSNSIFGQTNVWKKVSEESFYSWKKNIFNLVKIYLVNNFKNSKWNSLIISCSPQVSKASLRQNTPHKRYMISRSNNQGITVIVEFLECWFFENYLLICEDITKFYATFIFGIDLKGRKHPKNEQTNKQTKT